MSGASRTELRRQSESAARAHGRGSSAADRRRASGVPHVHRRSRLRARPGPTADDVGGGTSPSACTFHAICAFALRPKWKVCGLRLRRGPASAHAVQPWKAGPMTHHCGSRRRARAEADGPARHARRRAAAAVSAKTRHLVALHLALRLRLREAPRRSAELGGARKERSRCPRSSAIAATAGGTSRRPRAVEDAGSSGRGNGARRSSGRPTHARSRVESPVDERLKPATTRCNTTASGANPSRAQRIPLVAHAPAAAAGARRGRAALFRRGRPPSRPHDVDGSCRSSVWAWCVLLRPRSCGRAHV